MLISVLWLLLRLRWLLLWQYVRLLVGRIRLHIRIQAERICVMHARVFLLRGCSQGGHVRRRGG